MGKKIAGIQKNRRESEIESWVRSRIESRGGRMFKFISPGTAGVPDRIVLLPDGVIYFIEFKKAGEQPAPLQQYWLDILAGLGFHAKVIAGMGQAEAFVNGLC